jgi:hypothetical protein
MKTIGKNEATRIKISGEITDLSREKTSDEEKISRLFFNLIDMPVEYLQKLKSILWKKN